MAKKLTKKVAVKKSATKKVAAKKTTAKKAPAKKVAAKKTAAKKAPAKKVAAKKTAAKKVASKKVAAKKIIETSITARVDVGFGNSLYIRGEGGGLNWNQGTLLENESPYDWSYKTTKVKSDIVFKFLINDEIWADGENQTVKAGTSSVSSPVFNW